MGPRMIIAETPNGEFVRRQRGASMGPRKVLRGNIVDVSGITLYHLLQWAAADQWRKPRQGLLNRVGGAASMEPWLISGGTASERHGAGETTSMEPPLISGGNSALAKSSVVKELQRPNRAIGRHKRRAAFTGRIVYLQILASTPLPHRERSGHRADHGTARSVVTEFQNRDTALAPP